VKYREQGFPEKEIHDGQIRVAHVYPGTYREAMASIGYITIFSRMNEDDEIVAHRFTTDSPFSIEEGLPLKAYDVIVASVHFDLQIPLLLRYLHMQRISLRKEERDLPLLVGGPAVWNPLPVSRVADAVFIGEGEDGIAEAIKGIYTDKKGYKHYNVFNTWLKNRARFARHDLSYRPPAVVAEESAYGKRAVYIEPSRGCNFGCRFCLIGWTKRPRRDRKLSQILEWILEGTENGGEKIFFYGSDLLGHPHLKKVLEVLARLEIPFALSSMRFDRIDDEFLEILRTNKTRTITVAPEVASVQLKAFINKNIPNDGLIELARRAKKYGIKRMKLYFLFGFPNETEKDFIALKELRDGIEKAGLMPAPSVNPVIPKPFTPFQWLPFAGVDYIQKWNKWIAKNLRGDTMNPKRAWIQAILSVGDEGVGNVLLRAFHDLNYSHWRKAFEDEGIDPEKYTKAERETPWMDYVDTGVNEKFLWKEWEKAQNGEFTPPCHERCSLCGVCFP